MAWNRHHGQTWWGGGGTPMGSTPRWTWTGGYPNGGYPTLGTPHQTWPVGRVPWWGGGGYPTSVVLDTPRSVCLLRLRRRTFLLKLNFTSSNFFKLVEYNWNSLFITKKLFFNFVAVTEYRISCARDTFIIWNVIFHLRKKPFAWYNLRM